MGKMTADELRQAGEAYRARGQGAGNSGVSNSGVSSRRMTASELREAGEAYRKENNIPEPTSSNSLVAPSTTVAPSTQPKQAAPAGASSGASKQSDAMKEQVDALKKQRDDAALKLSAYMRAGNMQKQAEEQLEIANRAGIDYANAYTNWKNQRNMEAVEDYNPEDNHFKAGDAVLSGVQNAFQSTGQAAVAASSYLSGSGVQATKAWKAKAMMEKGVKGTDAVKQAGLMDKREIPITDYKTKAELRHEKNLESVGAVEGGALQLINTISNMVPSIAANAFIPGAGLPLMAASAAGNKYSDAYEKYGNTDMAFILGLFSGATSMFTEQFGGIFGKAGNTAVGKAASKKLMEEAPGLFLLANSKGGKLLRDSFSEGLEEGAEDLINYAIEKTLTGDSDERDNIVYDMLLGALAGSVFGGVGTVVRTKAYNRLGKALNASPDAVSQLVEKGTEKGPGTAPYIYAQEVQKNPSNQMVGKLYDATVAYNADQGLSKLSTDVAQVTVEELKDMISLADRLAEAAKKLGVEANPEAVTAAVINKQTSAAVQAAENAVGEAYAPTVETPANAGEAAYNSALAGGVANQGIATRINNDPAAKQSFAALTGANFTGEAAHDIAEIQVATKRLVQSGKQAVSQSDYEAMVAHAGEQARARVTAEQQAQVEQLNAESEARRQSLLYNTIVDENGKRHVKEITDTDVRGDTGIGYKKAEITKSKKKTVDAVNNAAKYLGKTIVWFDGALQINGQYRLANGFRAPDGTIYVNINSADPLMVTFGHEMFHDLVSDGKYGGMIDTLVESPEYAATIKVELEHKEELYRANGIELTADEAAEEVAADICGSILGSKSMLEYIGARNAETATGIKGWLDRILNKLKGKPTAQEAYERLSESQRALIDGMEGRTEAEFYDPTIGEDVKYSIREEAPPAKTLVGYKVFVVKDGKLYPPMVANPNAEDTPVGVWLNADIGARAPDSKTGRMQVKAGGKGTQGGSGSLAFRPGWHLGEVPVASQFDRLNPETGKKELFPSNFVWAECLIAADIDYQEEAMSYGYTKSGKFQHSLAGLPKLPVDGYYKYRTNPRPDTVPWLITGAMKVNRILSDSDVAEILTEHGITPPQRQGGAKTLEQLGLSQYDGTQGRFSLMGRGNGYDGRSMSNNARKAYENGEKPLSKWSKSEILEAVESINPNVDCSSLNADTLKQYFLNQSSWHHTSAMYNETRFYSVDEAYIADLTQNDVDYLADHQVKTAKSAARDKSNDSAIDDTYAKARAIVNAGIVKTEMGAINKLLAGKSFGESYEKAAAVIKARDASRVNAWRKLPEGHWRKEYADLYDNDINAYIKKMYAPEKLSRNSKAFKALEGYFKQSADQTGAKNAQEKLSLMEMPTTDSTGRELSAEQREYFKNSKVRNDRGEIKPVYHGSPNIFTEFSADFMSMHGSSEGQGFYFTDYKPMAEGYQKNGGQLLEGYLNIQKPLSDSTVTITKQEVKKLLQAVDPTGDEVLVNYDPAGGIGYPSKAWYNRALDATVKAAMDYSESDSEILAEIANGGAGSGAVMEAARNVLGYDGYIVEGKYDGATVYVAFDSSQFKNVDNLHPTDSKDIRYSLADFEKNPLEYGRKKKHNKRSRYNEGETLFLRWENGSTPVGEVKKFRRFGKMRYYEKTADGCIELSRAQFAERSRVNYAGTYRGENQEVNAAFDYNGFTEGAGSGRGGGNRNAERAEPLYRQTLGEELRDDAGRGVRGDGGSSGGYTAGGSGLALTENTQGDYSLMDTLPQEKYFADLDQAVAEAAAKSEEALKAAQTEVTNLRQRLLDYRNHADAEAKMNERWRDAEAKLVADLAAAREREKAAQLKAEYMQKYNSLAKQNREQYNEKVSALRDEYRQKQQQERTDRVVQEEKAKSKARLDRAEAKSTTTEDVAEVLTEMPKKTEAEFKEKAAESWRTFKRNWVNTKDELERFGQAVGDHRITYAANNVGQASAAAQYSIGGLGQYDLNGHKIGEKNLKQIFEPAQKAGLTKEFYTYLLHEHNVDRMSIRERSQEQLAKLRADLDKAVPGFAGLTDENLMAAASGDAVAAKSYTPEQIAAARQYQLFREWVEKQFDKPVFGSSVTAADSRAAADELLKEHPEFAGWANDVYHYLDGLQEVRRQGGLISEEMVQRMKELYPHYVPTYRDMPSTSGGYSNPNSVAVNSTIKSAKGGNQAVMPIVDSMARQTLQVFSAAKKNLLGQMLYEDAMDTDLDVSEYIQNITEDGNLVDLDADASEKLDNTLRIWVDGKPISLHMSKAMADGFRPIEQSNSLGMKLLRSANSTFKKLVTQWNPVFIVRNLVRDAQSALFFTHYSLATFVRNYGKAAKEIASNGKHWQLYQAMGGKGTTYYDPKTGLSDRRHFKNETADKAAGAVHKIIDVLSFANEAVEQYPRLAEFISTMEATGDVQEALYNAADITTNFGRGGFAARKLNASLVPFFNPGMQGLSKNVRNIIDRRGAKEIGQLISRLLLNGVMPGIIMGLIYDGLKEDDDYKELSNYIKDSNILIKVGDNKFIKIPMGRDPSVITAFTNRVWRWANGEPASSAFSGYPSFAIEQVAPNNPLTNNIFAGITAMSTNKTWYGGDIVSSYMEDRPDYLQYDESTDAFSIWLGEVTRHGKNGTQGLSPKKVNYLIDQYSGFIGDWLLPAISKKADAPAVVKAFVVDSVRQNRLGSDFYDALDEAKQAKETDQATASDEAVYSYLQKQSQAASAITKQLREVYNSDISKAEKMEKADDLLALRNEIYRKALLNVGGYEETAKSIGDADSDVVKREANRKEFGAQYALEAYNKAVYEKAQEYVAQGVTYDQYYAAYFATRGITSDKDENGKTVTNSASRKKKEAIDKAVSGATTKQKHLLYEALGVSEKVW